MRIVRIQPGKSKFSSLKSMQAVTGNGEVRKTFGAGKTGRVLYFAFGCYFAADLMGSRLGSGLRLIRQPGVIPRFGSGPCAGAVSPPVCRNEYSVAVTGLVEQFLTTIGNADLEALPAMFAADANVGTPAKIDGKWMQLRQCVAGRANQETYAAPLTSVISRFGQQALKT